ncbi:Queuosine salvage protein [Aphelenchoides fujianensis]|nr:Queuosine salvage protein [Aphelenchoides fujianensis]
MSLLSTCLKADWEEVGKRAEQSFFRPDDSTEEIELPKGIDPSTCLWPKEAGEFVAQQTKSVVLNEQKAQEVAELIYEKTKKESAEKLEFNWHVLHPKFEHAEQQARWVFFADTINFAFWSSAGSPVEYDGNPYTGYYSAAALMKHAIDAHWYAVLDPHCWQRMTVDDCKKLFAGKLPLPHFRLKAINEAGNVIVKKYGGFVLNLLKAANGSAQRLIRLLVRDFRSYRDCVRFKGKTLMMLKRAQIFAADIHSALKNDPSVPFAKFDDIHTLTMFADYRVPQVLFFLGVLEYDEKLRKRLLEFTTLRRGHEFEVAIRGLSIHAVEKISEKVDALCAERGALERLITSGDIDVFLWLYRREHAVEVDKAIPHHATLTWFY